MKVFRQLRVTEVVSSLHRFMIEVVAGFVLKEESNLRTTFKNTCD